VWAALKGGVAKPIARVTPAGAVTDFATEVGSTPYDITTGSDGNLWFTDPGTSKVGKVTPAGAYTGFGGIGLVTPRGIASGPNGHLYIVVAGTPEVMEFNPATGTKVADIPLPGAANVQFIAKGPDNNMWVTDFSSPGKLFRINTTGSPTATAVPVAGSSSLLGVTAGPDGKVWFTEASGTPKIWRINTDGSSPTSTAQLTGGASDPEVMAQGQDGNVYVAIFNTAQVGQVTANPFAVTQFKTGISGTMGPRGIAKGPDGNMWYTNETQNKIGRFTVDPPPTPPSTGGGGGGGGGTTTTPTTTTTTTTPPAPGPENGVPQVSNVLVRPDRFIAGPQATAVAAAKKPARGPVGTTFTVMLSKDATAKLVIEQALPGRKTRTSCARPSRRNRKAKKCTRYKKRGTLTRTGLKGENAVPFSGRVGQKRLPSGKYRVGISATDSLGQTGLPQYATFTILAPGKAKGRAK
jgi:streptogramin lyase